MSGHKGLDKWFKQDWVDIGSKKKGGGHKKCGRSKQKADAKRKYPKCVPRAKANRMTEGEKRSAVSRKRAASNVGPKPTNVKTFTRTVAKVKKVQKTFARKIQILTVGEQRAKVMGKTEVANIFKKGKEAIRRSHGQKTG
jgi:hypothetical protein